ncbi:hypothetical protein BDN72DRAFT_961825 [Pluteus cervinus]|uniref:Uncharacterized protein n=1 Tax=Pluteus cervinus TaxID=181527 RepID=A0ACD3AKM3_9AGAR|nr:hypothetical protein BDN72DRAFT_961825 [Pluteus cervinus]
MTANIGQNFVFLPHGQVNMHMQDHSHTYNGPTGPGPSSAGHKSPLEELRERMSTGAAFDSAERPEPPRCHPDTRRLALCDLDAWIGDRMSPILFKWIMGWAGTGKSAIAQTLAETYARMHRLAASFFFFRNSSDCWTIEKFVATIAWQIMHSVPGARNHILQLIANDPTLFEKSFDGLWQTLVVDTLCHIGPDLVHPMVIIVDGVDECTSHQEQTVLLRALLRSTEQLSPFINLVIASRPEQQIQSVFDSFGVNHMHQIELADTLADQTDIRWYIECSFRDIRAARVEIGIPLPDTWPPVDTIPTLVVNAGGQFVYASTVIAFMRGNGDNDPEARLKSILHGHSKSFGELDNLYLVILKNIQASIHPKERYLLHYLLVCLFVTSAGVVIHQPGTTLLNRYISKKISPSLLYSFLGMLHPFVMAVSRFDKPDHRFRHKTFCDFLTQPSNPHPFSITAHHLSSVIIQALSSGIIDPLQDIYLWTLHKPSLQLILYSAWSSQRLCGQSYPDVFLKLLYNHDSGMIKWLNIWWQLLLFVVGWLYYSFLTIKQTSPYLYRFRDHDLPEISLQITTCLHKPHVHWPYASPFGSLSEQELSRVANEVIVYDQYQATWYLDGFDLHLSFAYGDSTFTPSRLAMWVSGAKHLILTKEE